MLHSTTANAAAAAKMLTSVRGVVPSCNFWYKKSKNEQRTPTPANSSCEAALSSHSMGNNAPAQPTTSTTCPPPQQLHQACATSPHRQFDTKIACSTDCRQCGGKRSNPCRHSHGRAHATPTPIQQARPSATTKSSCANVQRRKPDELLPASIPILVVCTYRKTTIAGRTSSPLDAIALYDSAPPASAVSIAAIPHNRVQVEQQAVVLPVVGWTALTDALCQ